MSQGNDPESLNLEERTRRITARLQPHVGMAILAPNRTHNPGEIIHSGTMSFIDTGNTLLCVTSGHVFSKYLELRSTNSETVLAVTGAYGTRPVATDEWVLIDSDTSNLDIAILRPPDPNLASYLGKVWFRSADWPTRPPVVGDLACHLGFPGAYRQPRGDGLGLATVCVVDYVTSISDRHIVLANEELERVLIKHNPEFEDTGSLAGMSGSAVYVYQEDNKDLRLVGFVYEAGVGKDAMLFASTSEYIRSDGTLDRSLMPWPTR